MTFLEALYEGDITPSDKSFHRDSRYADLVAVIADTENALCQRLDAAGREQLDKLMDAKTEICCIEAKEMFIHGWQMGAKCMLESLLLPYQGELKTYK